MIGVAACGEDDTTTSAARATGNGIDRAFVAEMIAHHRSAVEMAKIAEQRTERPKIKDLAEAIISTQSTEIDQMQAVDRRLKNAGVSPGDVGMAEHEMGADMDAEMLRGANPFDREFIDAMIPHHQEAIRMARMELERGENRELQRLADEIVDAQSREIDLMNEWRIHWYGGLSPAGGIPPAADHAGHGG